MNWVLEHLQILIGVAAAIAYFLNRSRADAGEAGRASGETEEARAERTRQLQDEIRRKIAERRAAAGEAPPLQPAAGAGRVRDRMPPLVRPTQVPPIDPFGGPMRRIVREFEAAAEKQFEPEREREREEAEHKAVLARQEKLAEEMRALEAARVAEQRRAAELAARKREERETAGRGRVGSPVSLSEQLRDPRELRRAFVLREVLGAPVALR